jgi:PAS domain S-box-containing protein
MPPTRLPSARAAIAERLKASAAAVPRARPDTDVYFRCLVEMLPAALFTCEAPSGRISFFNARAAELWGREPVLGVDRFCGAPRLWRPDGAPLTPDETPMARAVLAGRAARNEELIVERPDGSRVVVVVNIDPILGEDGRVVAAMNVFHEATPLRSGEQARAWLASIVDASDDAVISKDLNGVITTWNRGAQRIFGYTAEEAIGRPVTILMPPDRLQEEPEILERVGRGERVDHYETLRRRKDGQLIDVSLSVSPIVDPSGLIVGASKIARDIGARMQAERVRARLAAIVASSDDAIVSKDLNGVITTWNQGAERIFGYAAEEAIGRSITMLMPPDRVSEEPGILARIRRGERVEHYETVRRRKDGTLLDVSLTVSPIIDEHGTIIGASKIARDVTEQKRALARDARNQEVTARLYALGNRCADPAATLVECVEDILETAIWLTGAAKGNVQLCDAGSGALKIVAQRGFGAAFLDGFSRVDAEVPATCGAALGERRRVVVEDVTTSPVFVGTPSLDLLLDEGVRAVQSTPLVSGSGQVLGVVSTHFTEPRRLDDDACRLLDMLARQAADYVERQRDREQREELLRVAEAARREAETANRAKDEFLAMLGHELRNPLSAVRNAVAAAQMDERSRPRALAIARRQADQLATIVDDLLDVARIMRGRVPLRKVRVALADAVQRSVEGARALMEERGHRVDVLLPQEAIVLDADPARLEQALGNLLANAAKYTHPGGTVAVTGRRDGADAVVEVRDDGMGIAPDVLPRIFELFAQGERSLDRAQGGLGIGLTLARRIVELHGGTLTARSEGLGKGATFTVRLPAAAAVATPATAAVDPADRVEHAARVLMVEDNPDAAESLVMILELLGHHVRIVNDGMSALRIARANVPDVMLVDIGLPGMSGYDVARAVREDVGLKRLVLIALTGYGRPEDKTRALEAGFDYHLVKPVDATDLAQLVSRVVAR